MPLRGHVCQGPPGDYQCQSQEAKCRYVLVKFMRRFVIHHLVPAIRQQTSLTPSLSLGLFIERLALQQQQVLSSFFLVSLAGIVLRTYGNTGRRATTSIERHAMHTTAGYWAVCNHRTLFSMHGLLEQLGVITHSNSGLSRRNSPCPPRFRVPVGNSGLKDSKMENRPEKQLEESTPRRRTVRSEMENGIAAVERCPMGIGGAGS